MSHRSIVNSLLVLACVASSLVAAAQTAAAPAAPAATSNYLIPYGPPITLETAKKAAGAAEAEAARNHWLMTIAIVDPTGNLVYYERMDSSQWGSSKMAIAKARSAALYKRPTKALQDGVAKGGTNILAYPDALPLEGGEPLMSNGKLIGAIGVSGDLSPHDDQCASAGAQSLK